jgi:hypothetical protein
VLRTCLQVQWVLPWGQGPRQQLLLLLQLSCKLRIVKTDLLNFFSVGSTLGGILLFIYLNNTFNHIFYFINHELFATSINPYSFDACFQVRNLRYVSSQLKLLLFVLFLKHFDHFWHLPVYLSSRHQSPCRSFCHILASLQIIFF